MKRKLFYFAGLALMAWSFTSCETMSCKVCRQNTYNSSGDLLTEGSETQYCGAELIGIETTKDVTVGGITTKWVCR